MSPTSAAGRRTAASRRGCGAASQNERHLLSLVGVALCCCFCCLLTCTTTPFPLLFVQSVATDEAATTTPAPVTPATEAPVAAADDSLVAAPAQELVAAADDPLVAAATQAPVAAADDPLVAAATQAPVAAADDSLVAAAAQELVAAADDPLVAAPEQAPVATADDSLVAAAAQELVAAVEGEAGKGVGASTSDGEKAAGGLQKFLAWRGRLYRPDTMTDEIKRRAQEVERQRLHANSLRHYDDFLVSEDDGGLTFKRLIEKGKETPDEFPTKKRYAGTTWWTNPDGPQLSRELGHWDSKVVNKDVINASLGELPHYNLSTDRYLRTGEANLLRVANRLNKKARALRWGALGASLGGLPMFGSALWNVFLRDRLTFKNTSGMTLGAILFFTGLLGLLPHSAVVSNEAKRLQEVAAKSIALRYKQEELVEEARMEGLKG